tara:strand:+ start:1038 stop:1631 length:594 start_codon:yes stop_codon:yes gene_type:complete
MAKVSAKGSSPIVRLPGLIVGSHTAVFLGALVVYCVTASNQVLAFAIVAFANAALTYVEQLAALYMFRSQKGSYFMTFDLLGNTSIGATNPVHAGVSPVQDRLWELPSVTAQLLSMTAAYWTLATMDRIAAEREERSGQGTPSLYARTLGIWASAAVVLAYAAHYSYSTVLQIGTGVVFGTAVGVTGYKMSSTALSQ